MKKSILCAWVLAVMAGSAMALCPAGWMYCQETPGQRFLYDSNSGRWHFVADSPASCAVNMNTGRWYKFEHAELRAGWSYWQWPYAYCSGNQSWYFIAASTAPWMYDFSGQRWQQLGAQTANLTPGVWQASAANTYTLSITVNAQDNVSAAYLKVYYNDGWLGNDSYTFTSSDISTTGSSFLAKKERAVINSAGDSLYYYEISGNFETDGTVRGTYKGSYYQKPRGASAHTNTKQGSFTARR